MRRRFLTHEVVQTSALDCGPAALKALLEGYGIPTAYDRLREACQTDLDGTSIDTIEHVAVDLGLAAEQVMVPRDHLLSDPSTLPAVVVVRLPQNLTHFVLVWRKVGPFLQIMDPATGRRWVRGRAFLDEVYLHQMAVRGADWKEWAVSSAAKEILTRRLAGSGIETAVETVAAAARQEAWQPLATLDAAARLMETLVARGAVRKGPEAERLLRHLIVAAPEIPARYWNAKPIDGAAADADARLTGAVLVRVAGAAAPTPYRGPSRDVAAAVGVSRPSPFRQLFGSLRQESRLTLALAAAAVAAAAACLASEPVLLRAAVDFRGHLTAIDQRVRATAYLCLFGVTALLLEHRFLSESFRLGRVMETRFRADWLGRLATLPETYFRSRLVSDMAERAHATHHLHDYPHLAARLGQAVLTLALVSAGIVLVAPSSGGLVVTAAFVTIALALAFVPTVQRHDVKVRTHAGALARFYLDALRGLTAIRAHSGESAVRREHEALLVEWSHASRAHAVSLLAFETAQGAAGFGLALCIVARALSTGHDPAAILLVAYWAFTYPRLGVEIATLVKQRAEQRSVALRLIEPLREPGRRMAAGGESVEHTAPAAGVAVRMRGVTVRAGGHLVLRDVDLEVGPGEHVAVVGASGAGKSALVGLLLGRQHVTSGAVEIDGRPLTDAALASLRAQTAWVDPTVRLWNESLAGNLTYGAPSAEAESLAAALTGASLYELVERRGGLQGAVGEGGGLLSGGEGQRVRFARALMRRDARLVIVDEAFRGLDRETRRRLLDQARAQWRGATLFFVTHDLHDTLGLDRVVVMAGGAVAECDTPQSLSTRPGSHYARLLRLERESQSMWADGRTWRHLRLEHGEIAAQGPHAQGNEDRAFATHVASR